MIMGLSKDDRFLDFAFYLLTGHSRVPERLWQLQLYGHQCHRHRIKGIHSGSSRFVNVEGAVPMNGKIKRKKELQFSPVSMLGAQCRGFNKVVAQHFCKGAGEALNTGCLNTGKPLPNSLSVLIYNPQGTRKVNHPRTAFP